MYTTNKMVRIQYASDLHLWYKSKPFEELIVPTAEILVLAGDIGDPFKERYRQFLEWCAEKFACIVLIAGNHEYYGNSLEKGEHQLRTLCRDTGVHFLEREALELPEYNIVILGTTLWSRIPSRNALAVLTGIADYRCINDFNLQTGNDLYYQNKDWLDQMIQFYSKKCKVVVVTHHAPVKEITSAPMYRGMKTNCAFASDCTDIMYGVAVWIFGHTHYSTEFEYTISDTSVLITSNQHGYMGENTGYKNKKFITVG